MLPSSAPRPIPNSEKLPTHVGIIMDGNGRWAREQKKPRSFGHKEGLATTKKIVKYAADIGLRYLSLYVFSTENWKRTQEEVGYLMGLVDNHILAELPFYRKHQIRICFAGNKTALSKNLQKKIREAEQETKEHSGLVLQLALNYGGRDEILRAIQRWQIAGAPPLDTEEAFNAYLDNPDIPDIDLVIRTAGEYRLSNFFPWQTTYAELFIDNKLWPDWNRADFSHALKAYAMRDRKYGALNNE